MRTARAPRAANSLVLCLLAGAVFAVYWPALRNGFVWDDTALVLRDPFIRSWRLLWVGARHFLFTDATGSNFYRPIQRWTYTLDYALYGFGRVWGYHLTNIVLHAGAACALYCFLARNFARAEGAIADAAESLAGVAALFWAVLPLHSSAVIYVAGRADLLAAFFGFTGLWMAEMALAGRRSWLWGAGACVLGAMLSKESGLIFAALPFVFLPWDGRGAPRRWVLPICAALAIYAGLRFSAHEVPPPPKPPVPAAVRPILAARAFAEYAGLLAAPVHLHMERDLAPVGNDAETLRKARLREYQTLLGVALMAAFAIWCRWAWRNERAIFRFLLAFLLAYLPVSNLFSLNAAAAEHWLYVPSAFLLPAVALSLAVRFADAGWGIRAAIDVLASGWLIFFAARTFVRNADWHDDRRFFETTIRDGGDSARMLTNLGSLESGEGHYAAAIGDFDEALKRPGDQPFAHLGLAAACIRTKDFAKAREELGFVADEPFFRAEYLQYLATIEYLQNGADRVDLLREAAGTGKWAAEKRYISHLAERGDKVEGITELKHVLEREPYRAESWRMMGELLAPNRPDLAREAFAQAAAYDVHDDESRGELARLDQNAAAN